MVSANRRTLFPRHLVGALFALGIFAFSNPETLADCGDYLEMSHTGNLQLATVLLNSEEISGSAVPHTPCNGPACRGSAPKPLPPQAPPQPSRVENPAANWLIECRFAAEHGATLFVLGGQAPREGFGLRLKRPPRA
jgi:hypothetical protein